MPRSGWTMNFGSGKLFRERWLNVDINPFWQPDIVADLARPFPATVETVFSTSRFGNICLPPGCAERIVAHDLLEHLPQLDVFYANCLSLLQEGGVLDVVVPYDLSYGAWQDPSHMRAFNEHSWLYVTDWHWYLGWTEARFALERLDWRYSELGQSLLEQGLSEETVRRTPRAVDAMAVLLRKRRLSAREQQRTAERLAKYQHRPAGFIPAEPR
ncbi:class I SAM-dependent methyltransferase [Megalodesulfovibrio paquesii]